MFGGKQARLFDSTGDTEDLRGRWGAVAMESQDQAVHRLPWDGVDVVGEFHAPRDSADQIGLFGAAIF